MDMVLEDVVLISAVQLLSDVTKLMQEQTSVEKSVKLDKMALSLAEVVEVLNEEV